MHFFGVQRLVGDDVRAELGLGGDEGDPQRTRQVAHGHAEVLEVLGFEAPALDGAAEIPRQPQPFHVEAAGFHGCDQAGADQDVHPVGGVHARDVQIPDSLTDDFVGDAHGVAAQGKPAEADVHPRFDEPGDRLPRLHKLALHTL